MKLNEKKIFFLFYLVEWGEIKNIKIADIKLLFMC